MSVRIFCCAEKCSLHSYFIEHFSMRVIKDIANEAVINAHAIAEVRRGERCIAQFPSHFCFKRMHYGRHHALIYAVTDDEQIDL